MRACVPFKNSLVLFLLPPVDSRFYRYLITRTDPWDLKLTDKVSTAARRDDRATTAMFSNRRSRDTYTCRTFGQPRCCACNLLARSLAVYARLSLCYFAAFHFTRRISARVCPTRMYRHCFALLQIQERHNNVIPRPRSRPRGQYDDMRVHCSRLVLRNWPAKAQRISAAAMQSLGRSLCVLVCRRNFTKDLQPRLTLESRKVHFSPLSLFLSLFPR